MRRFGAGFAVQGLALEHAEAVLLVDDDQAETLEADGLLDQRMGADDDAQRAVGQLFVDFFLLGGRDAAGQQADFDAQRREPPVQRQRVLLGKHGRRRHHGGLHARVERLQERHHGDDGFSRTDVALQQAVHGHGAAHVVGDFLRDAALIVGEFERKFGEELPRQIRLPSQRRGFLFEAAAAVAQRQADLEQKEFLEDEALPRGAEERFVGGLVHLAHGGSGVDKMELLDDRRRQDIGDRRGQRFEHRVDDAAQPFFVQPGRRGINGHDAPHAARVAAVEDLELGIEQLRHGAARLQRAVKRQFHAFP